MKGLVAVGAALGAVFLSSGVAGAATFALSYEPLISYSGEAQGVENTSATFSVSGVETFEELSTSKPYKSSFSADFRGAGGAIQGTYSAGSSNGVQINSADKFGGAGGTGKYIAAFGDTPYSLSLTSTVPGGINYFGYWLSALDPGNTVTFYGDGGQKLFTFNPKDVIAAVNATSNPSAYYGNPDAPFKGQDSGEPYIFVNFFDTAGSFTRVDFSEVNFGGGYESDNHTVGHYLTMGNGTPIPLVYSSSAPEPATWAMMLLGLAGLSLVGAGRARGARSLVDA